MNEKELEIVQSIYLCISSLNRSYAHIATTQEHIINKITLMNDSLTREISLLRQELQSKNEESYIDYDEDSED